MCEQLEVQLAILDASQLALSAHSILHSNSLWTVA